MSRRQSMGYLPAWFLLAIALMYPHATDAQSAEELGLILTATRSSSTGNCKHIEKGQECRKYRMKFENKGIEPVIILNPTLGFGSGAKTLISYGIKRDQKTNTSSEVEFRRQQVIPDPDERANLKALFPLLDSERPPENLTLILRPGEGFTFEEMFVIEEEQDLFFRDQKEAKAFFATAYDYGVSWRCLGVGQRNICRMIPRSYQLVYEFPLRAGSDDPDLLDNLARRWRTYGRLLTGPDGMYMIASEMFK